MIEELYTLGLFELVVVVTIIIGSVSIGIAFKILDKINEWF